MRKIDEQWYLWLLGTFKLQSRNSYHDINMLKLNENKSLPIVVEDLSPIFVDFVDIPDQSKELLALRPRILIERWHHRYYGGLLLLNLFLTYLRRKSYTEKNFLVFMDAVLTNFYHSCPSVILFPLFIESL